MEVRWFDDALSDLERIQDFLLDRNPTAAMTMIAELRQAVEQLSTLPHRGRPGRWAGTRELIVPGTAYILPYRVRKSVVEILRVFHGAQAWPDRPID
ncbi:MAG: type II toxin-antitoxin system RelE/ParE family toxin [Geminicoccaceae bacterium]